MENELIFLVFGGLISGLLAGLLGIGGGTVLVPLLVTLNYTPLQAVATSSLAIVLTSISGSIQNWRMGYLDFKRVFSIGIPALISAQLGVYLASQFQPYLLLLTFGLLLAINIFLVRLRKNLEQKGSEQQSTTINPVLARLGTGASAGLLAGLFGVGGGVIMVPLQMLLLGEKIKVAIQTSLGVIVITAIAATAGHAIKGNVLFGVGLILGTGGLIGAQISTRYLPKLSEQIVSFSFNLLLAILSVYTFWQAWQKYAGN